MPIKTASKLFLLLLIFGCTDDVDTPTPTADCRIAMYACADGFTCRADSMGVYDCRSGDDDSMDEDPDTPNDDMPGNNMGGMPGDNMDDMPGNEMEEPSNDCRTAGCPNGKTCTFDGNGNYYCQQVSQCAENNGGCGDPNYIRCVDDGNGTAVCIDIAECATNNGGCGDPNEYYCVELDGTPPYCEPIVYAESPFVVGVYTEAFTYQGDVNIENCHRSYAVSSSSSTDTSGGCESCSYAWELYFDLVYESCDERADTRNFTSSIGLDVISRDALVVEDGAWVYFGGGTFEFTLSGKSMALVAQQADPFATAPYAPAYGANGYVYTLTTFLELKWDNEQASCGDNYCDYGDHNCDQDCGSSSSPASGYTFRTYGFDPESNNYQNCYNVRKLSNRNRAPSGGCNNCTNSWYFQDRVEMSNCGSWTGEVGTTKRIDLGARNGHEVVYYRSDSNDWRPVTSQFSDYSPNASTLMAAFDTVGYQDIDKDGRRDGNEPRRARTQVLIIHHD